MTRYRRLTALVLAPIATISMNPNAGLSAADTVTVVNAASYRRRPLAPDSIAAAFGTQLATTTATATAPLPTTLGGTSVRIRGSQGSERLAPLFYVSPTQISLLIPSDLTPGTATVTVTNGIGMTSTGTLELAAVGPGVFSANSNGLGVPAAQIVRVRADGSQSYEALASYDEATRSWLARPIAWYPSSDDLLLILYGTGFRGATTPVSASLGSSAAQVTFAGAHPTYVGLDQINVRLPRGRLRGRVPIDLRADGVGISQSVWFHLACTDDLQVVAHQDDDLLFMSPDLADAIASGRCVRTVYVTAGNDDKGRDYWGERERGIKAAYAMMAGTPNVWTHENTPVRIETLDGRPETSLVFLRLPDTSGASSLTALWQGDAASVSAVDGSASYTRQGLIDRLGRLMLESAPGSIRTLDYTGRYGNDHADHLSSARFAVEARRQYPLGQVFDAYRGYNVSHESPNVDGAVLERKRQVFLKYAAFDSALCPPSPPCTLNSDYESWLARQYKVTPP